MTTDAPNAAASHRLGRQLVFMLFVFAYASAFYYAYVEYLNPVWDYFGFHMAALTPDRAIVGLLLLTLTGALQKPGIASPSAITVFLLYINIYIPCLITTLLLSNDSLNRYGPMLAALSLVFASAGALIENGNVPTVPPATWMNPRLERITLVAWAIAFVILGTYFRSIMSLSSPDDSTLVYDQRTAGATDNTAIRYLLTYFSNIFTPTILVVGLVRRRALLVLCGFIGSILMYAINAQRTLLLLPVIMVAVFLLLHSRRFRDHAAHIIMGTLSLAMVWSCTMQQDNLGAAVVAVLLTFRTVAIPGLTVSQYEDLFSEIGRTHWSNVKGFDLIIPPPDFAFNEPLWPDLGYIVGDRLYNNPIFNVNANLFAGDGIAAAGSWGVVVIGLVFIVWIKLIEKYAKHWNPLFATLVLLPPAISLTNGHFFTTMLSFGGLFWLIILKYAAPTATVRLQ